MTSPPATPGSGPARPLAGTPTLPQGRPVDLPSRGTTFVRDTGASPGAPVLLLLHGWGVTADLNWFRSYGPLAAAGHRVLSIDHRGHGRGIRPVDGPVRLSDLADDAAALLEVLGVARATAVGYSLGGAVAQLLWRRHPDRVGGLVLASTASTFRGGPLTALGYRALTPLAQVAGASPQRADALLRRRVARRIRQHPRGPWMRSELVQVQPAALLSSLRSLGRFHSRPWIGEVDVPTAVVVTTRDRTVAPRRQRQLLAAIPAAHVVEVEGPHDAVITQAETYGPALVKACRAVTGA